MHLLYFVDLWMENKYFDGFIVKTSPRSWGSRRAAAGTPLYQGRDEVAIDEAIKDTVVGNYVPKQQQAEEGWGTALEGIRALQGDDAAVTVALLLMYSNLTQISAWSPLHLWDHSKMFMELDVSKLTLVCVCVCFCTFFQSFKVLFCSLLVIANTSFALLPFCA